MIVLTDRKLALRPLLGRGQTNDTTFKLMIHHGRVKEKGEITF